MKQRVLVSLMAALALAPVFGAQARAQSFYTFTDLGVLTPASPWTRGMDINNAGQVSAVSRQPTGGGRIVRITPTTDALGNLVWFQDANADGVNDLMQVLPLPAGGYTLSFANPMAGINASGQITATARGTAQSAVVWSASGLPTLIASTSVTTDGFGINDGGDVAGDYWNYKKPKSGVLAYLYQFTAGSYTGVALSSSTGYEAWAINNLRQVIGWNGSGPAAFLWLPSAAYGLPKGYNVLAGLNIQPGKTINNAGLIAGYNAASHLCLWAPSGGSAAYGLAGGLNDLGNSGWSLVYSHALNNPPSDQPLRTAGQAQDAAGNWRAFLWDSVSRSIQDLNGLVINLPAGWVLTSANGINDPGQIVGEGTYNGANRGFVLTPQ